MHLNLKFLCAFKIAKESLSNLHLIPNNYGFVGGLVLLLSEWKTSKREILPPNSGCANTINIWVLDNHLALMREICKFIIVGAVDL